MTRFEQPADDPYSRLDHMDGLGENLAALPVESRREFMAADTNPVSDEYQNRPSRRASLAIVASLLGFTVAVTAVAAIVQVTS